MLKAAANQQRRITATEKKTEGVHIPPAVGKRIVVSFLGAKKNGHKNAVYKEIEEREIKHKEPLKNMKWYPLLNLLKVHELGILSGRPGGATVNGKAMTSADVKDIVPQTDALRALLPEQSHWQANKRKR